MDDFVQEVTTYLLHLHISVELKMSFLVGFLGARFVSSWVEDAIEIQIRIYLAILKMG